eukprot:gnl/TRDRNA2_/TRDRNA2_86096_c0_seq1.p1 gnl/TRDRNA2_/TRDRNA2_86096_c0~~gnl/TRDRNA2_/TRDRNA2_86096_c0_seq1.p1  ORF type:complete len:512 (+),score=69.32 gnl/TRDRNA2_/TRDRNA2_86096_c0_seq1:52-1587(+)
MKLTRPNGVPKPCALLFMYQSLNIFALPSFPYVDDSQVASGEEERLVASMPGLQGSAKAFSADKPTTCEASSGACDMPLSLLQTKASVRRASNGTHELDHPTLQVSNATERLSLLHQGPDTWLGLNLLKEPPKGQYVPKNAQKYIFRPSYRKYLRCADPGTSLIGCEECIGPQDCFGDMDIYDKSFGYQFGIRESPKNSFHRFVAIVHIDCQEMPVSKLNLRIQYLKASKGTMKMFWDGQELKNPNTFEDYYWDGTKVTTRKDRVGYYWPNIPDSGTQGGHTLMIQVTRGAGIDFTAVNWMLGVDPGYANCLDTQACLKNLDEIGPAGGALRSSNVLLRQCLNKPFEEVKSLPVVGSACFAWRQCMRKTEGDMETHVALLLNAGSFSEGAGISSLASDKSCMDPAVEDPLGWECDCFEQMNHRCASAGANTAAKTQECLRAGFCASNDVCEAWKLSVCKNEAMQEWMKKLEAVDASLVQSRSAKVALTRRLMKDEEAATSFDDTTNSKKCK